MSATSKVGMLAETVTIQHENSAVASAGRAFQIKHRRCASIGELKHQALACQPLPLRPATTLSGARRRPEAMITVTGAMRCIEGPRLRLRLVLPDDAAYIHGLRADPRYSPRRNNACASRGECPAPPVHREIFGQRVLVSSSFLRHYDESKICPCSIP